MPEATTKAEYLQQPEVKEITQALAGLIPQWSITYDSRFQLLKKKTVKATGVEDVLSQYAWPAKVIAPRAVIVGGKTIQASDVIQSYNWITTKHVLEALSERLKDALSRNCDDDVLAWAGCVLDWGMGQRGASSKKYLQSLREQGVAHYLRAVDAAVCSDDIENITEAVAPVVNSGMAKVHSLASCSNLIIFDSRVALALGSAVNFLLVKQGHMTIPDTLRFGRCFERTPLVLVGGENQPIMSRNSRWLRSQLRATWLLEDVLLQTDVFEGSLGERIHSLEAALFMIGTQPEAVVTGLRA